MDMEFEIEGLRQQLTQKTVELIHLRKENTLKKLLPFSLGRHGVAQPTGFWDGSWWLQNV
jgi:hypothetical protein